MQFKNNQNCKQKSEEIEKKSKAERLWFDVERLMQNCNVQIAILLSKKEFSKNSSLITRNAVSCCDIDAYSANSPCTTRHPTRHLNCCILLRMWILYAWFTLHSLVTLKKVTSESSLQLAQYQNIIPCEGDEWVTSDMKWITAVILWCTLCYSVMGDELTSSVKILFFYL